ncbi:SulP family inorganic anion transporter [Rhizobium sp. NZLR1]|nr:SulP family inorganic anion transporter [Rhizobium sp. NZLR8]MBX5162002.1 SulP family inorganic anion transporter [Rhizobium sp. NZLR4b]MBX5171124.1 SulP family inorganic anion transporter [Rhizobium sp. NZLR1b]MBX5181156.1 SulP family inorganic anion transporter [Rhizobium sp. NZLR5]MBX5188061.1 SulP family inorganic anion transporter [Rhizobium sp. NZLR3b]MBX5200527.1 SulP family inorganic anion transporter [Rhizobium sp. NZLR1]MBX5206223.1 SulP family inorganic anion transporter [Rhizob
MIGSLPMLRGLAGFNRAWLRSDIPAGLSIAAVGLPSAIAYPAIAGLPPETGIYASIVAPIAYAIFGPSRLLVVGPDAATMTVLAAAMGAIIATGPAATDTDRIAIASALALGVGVCCIAARLLRLGVLASFLSRPILVGFFAGVSLSILVGQIGRFTGLKIESDGLIPPLVELLAKSSLIHWPSLLLGLIMFALLWVVRAFHFRVPGPVLVVVLSVVLSAIFDFQGRGIAVVGDIPSGLPSLSLPALHRMPLDKIVLGSAAIFLVSFGAGIVAARSFASRTGEEVDANQELIGLGAANIAPALFGSFPVSVSDSRTAINLSTGGVSQAAGLVSAATLIAALVFLHSALRILPIPALAAILATAAISLIDVHELKKIWRVSRMEFIFALIAMWGAISFGVLNGVVVAVAATFAYLLRQTMFPRDGLLGRIEGRHGFFDLRRFPEARSVEGAAVFAIQGSILFYNADYLRMRLTSVAKELAVGTRCLVLDASAITHIDSTGATALEAVAELLAQRNIIFAIADLSEESRGILERAGVIKAIGADNLFNGREEALRTLIGDFDQTGTAASEANVP